MLVFVVVDLFCVVVFLCLVWRFVFVGFGLVWGVFLVWGFVVLVVGLGFRILSMIGRSVARFYFLLRYIDLVVATALAVGV
ncbi:hypothetical protein, partial [Yersinia hibernica]|uniref:hypothetical protein n=1 Tax=Yersinia hibernica TaxID=2339259 RepID=UPI001C962EF0